MSLARVFCSWSIAAVLLLLSIALSTSEKSLDPAVDENGEEGNGTSNVTLTGNPQIDYVHDPNLPRELNGYNLSDYPFYHRVPKNINFSCDGRKDGFYASIEHKCQIYHHCLFGSRFDFICANYTAFDQRTFICQFVSDVDCPNSHMYFHRNEALYVTKSTTTPAPRYDLGLYERRRPPKKPKGRPRLAEEAAAVDTQKTAEPASTAAPAAGAQEDPAESGPAPPKRKDQEYAEEDYYDDDWDYPRRRKRPKPLRRKCRNGRRRGRRCRPRRPMPYYYDDYYDDDDYDYAYYDDDRIRAKHARKRPPKVIASESASEVASSSSETPPPSSTTSTTTTTTEPPPFTSSEVSLESGPLDSEAIAALQVKRDELLYKTRRPLPIVRPLALRPSRQNDKPRSGSSTTSTTSTERAKPSTTTTTTTTTTEVPQYVYDYEYYEDDAPMMEVPTTTTSTTQKPPLFRGKTRGGNSAAATLTDKQRVVQQSSIHVRVTEDAGTNTNTIRRRDNSNVQTPTRVATPSPPTTSTTAPPPPPTSPVSRPARFWQRKSTVKSISTTVVPTTTTTTLAPYYQDYQEYEDVSADPQPSAPSIPMSPSAQQQMSSFQPLINAPQHQYGTVPARQTYNPAPVALPPQQSVTSSRGHHHSLSSTSSYSPRPNKHYAMQQQSQQYSQSSSTSSSVSSSNSNNNNNLNNYNTNTYHRQRNPAPPPSVVPKPEFISLVDEDYNNPYVSPVGGVGPTSPSSTRLTGGGGGAVGGPGYHHQQHPIRFFEQHGPPSFLFGAASEYQNPQFAFPPNRNYPSPSNFQPYGHSTRRFAANIYK